VIAPPLNDRSCLSPVTRLAQQLVTERDPDMVELAARLGSPQGVVRWLASRPQVDDTGGNDGPRVAACWPAQRLWLPTVRTDAIPEGRVPLEEYAPNCFERALAYVVLAELLDARPVRRLESGTVWTTTEMGARQSLHTYPTEDGQIVVLDPVVRNGLGGVVRALRITRVEVLDWIATLAEVRAALTGDTHRVRNARITMRSVMTGQEVRPQSVADIAYTVEAAAPEARRRGEGDHHRHIAADLVDALVTQRRRNAALTNQLDNLIDLVATAVAHELTPGGSAPAGAPSQTPAPPSQSSAAKPPSLSSPSPTPASAPPASAKPPSQLGKVGLGHSTLQELEALFAGPVKTGLALGGTALGGPVVGALGSLIGNALLPSSATPARNAGAISVKTPGAILDEIHTTDTAVRALGADIWAQFKTPFEQQQDAAEARFLCELGRKPYGSATTTNEQDLAQVYAWMQPVPTAVDIDAHGYQGGFVSQWAEFTKEWSDFVARHEHWQDRMWGADYDKAIEMRDRVAQWRQRFIELGGKPNSPDPDPPPKPTAIPWKTILLVAGLGTAGVLVLRR
jgi:hypothetical protein